MVRETLALVGLLAGILAGPALSPEPAASSAPAVVRMAGDAFAPATVTIAAGAVVRFENDDTDAHTVTAPGLFDSGGLDPKQTFTYRFTNPGTYHYVCSIHPWMKGKVVVRESQ